MKVVWLVVIGYTAYVIKIVLIHNIVITISHIYTHRTSLLSNQCVYKLCCCKRSYDLEKFDSFDSLLFRHRFDEMPYIPCCAHNSKHSHFKLYTQLHFSTPSNKFQFQVTKELLRNNIHMLVKQTCELVNENCVIQIRLIVSLFVYVKREKMSDIEYIYR